MHFAIKRGSVLHDSISCSPLTPALLTLIAEWRTSPYFRGELSQWVSINPSTEVPDLQKDDYVSFIPMEAVGEKNGEVDMQIRTLDQVSVGYTRFAENDLIWAKITPCMQNGKAAVVRGLIGDVGFGSTEFHVLRPKNDEVLPDYLQFVLTLDQFLIAAQAAFSGSAGQQRVSDTFLKNLPVPLPPLEIQRELVAEMQAARDRRAQHLRDADAELAGMDAFLMDALRLN